jgi:hypothetical protein
VAMEKLSTLIQKELSDLRESSKLHKDINLIQNKLYKIYAMPEAIL